MRFTLDGESFELTPETVRARLAGAAPETIREYWVDINGTRWPVKQVISLATGADRMRFQSQSARRWLGNLGFELGGGPSVRPAEILTAHKTATAPRPTSRLTPAFDPPALPADVVLIGCVKTKRAHGASAKDLYASPYFAKMRGYAEASQLPWFILSAEHGLVAPDEWLEPYDRYLPRTSPDYRRRWGDKVAAQLERAVGPLSGVVFDVHAGAAYVDALRASLTPAGAEVIDQLRGLTFGQRLSWYSGRAQPSNPDARSVVLMLRDAASARVLEDVLATRGAGLSSPGLYSWWVDEAGAAEVTAGLGHEIRPGLLYAGQAGATRSGGSSSSNTLWGRISTMHLGRNSAFSTLRLSLGAILAEASGQPAIDETQLTRWMHAHLKVVTVAVADPGSLDALEADVLTELDPPLNLARVSRNPLRQRVSTLRGRHKAGQRPRQGEPSTD